MKTCFLALTVILLTCISCTAMTRKVLFIGNSYTFTNNMPVILQSIATAEGDTLIFDQSDPGGYTLQQHCSDATTITKIFSQQWDIVVIQDQSELPSFPPAEVDTEVYPFAARLDSMVRANDTCTQTMFMMTWGHANGDPLNCGSYPVICTYDGMQQRLHDSYLQMAVDNHADVAPVGMAFKIMMDRMYTPWLYNPDSSHPIVPGSYLEACVLYSSIFHKSTLNCTYTDGIADTDANLLQRIATKVVFDSFALWQQYGHYPYAGFTYHRLYGGSFTSLSPIPVHHYWDFGDGTHDTAANPVHSYGMGVYVFSHTVSTDCFTETLSDTVYAPESVPYESLSGNNIMAAQTGNGGIVFTCAGTTITEMEVYDILGRVIRRYEITGADIRDNFVPGLYVYKGYTKNKSATITGKAIIY